VCVCVFNSGPGLCYILGTR